MGAEPMELAKNYDPKHADKFLPGYMQVKYDGVPLTFIRPDGDDTVIALTRQNEEAKSVPHLLEQAKVILPRVKGASFTAECLVPGRSFKESSGIIRRQTPDAETAQVIGFIFDANLEGHHKETYYIRFKQIGNALPVVKMAFDLHNPDKQFPFVVAPYAKVETIEQVEAHYKVLLELHGADLEGAMIHKINKPFTPGKRAWGMCRYKPQPTIDLEVESFEEAVSEDGTGLGMVGRVNVRLRRKTAAGVAVTTVGVGPGKLTHAERQALWGACVSVDGHGRGTPSKPYLAEIKYMPDPSYDALRQPTIQRLRTDKTEGDILAY